ncbi:MAG: hypothetical protein L0Y54_04405 [Sporichthyaceae bacterium]|nr:hypothetical protein [Sporichthyaceae bacterium]
MDDQTDDRRTTIRLAWFAAAVLAAIALAFGMVSCEHDETPTASGPGAQLPAATGLAPEPTPSPTEDAEPT